jgi:hypothetical protein
MPSKLEAKELKYIHGHVVGQEPTDQREHFYMCEECGQAVDMRSLYQVLHHEESGHKPMSEAQLSETG